MMGSVSGRGDRLRTGPDRALGLDPWLVVSLVVRMMEVGVQLESIHKDASAADKV